MYINVSTIVLSLKIPAIIVFYCRDLVMSIKGPDAPIVIVGNKIDAERVVDKVGKLFPLFLIPRVKQRRPQLLFA